jgi:hypothetical protein
MVIYKKNSSIVYDVFIVEKRNQTNNYLVLICEKYFLIKKK